MAKLIGGHSHRSDTTERKARTKKSTRESVDAKLNGVVEVDVPHCCSRDPVEQLDTFQRMASVLQHERVPDINHGAVDGTTPTEFEERGQGRTEDKDESLVEEDFVDNLPLDPEHDHDRDHSHSEGLDANVPIPRFASQEDASCTGKKLDEEDAHDHYENKKLVKMGLNTALAIGLHNFPEGTTSRPEVGIPIFEIHIVHLKSNVCSHCCRTCNFCCCP